MAVTRNFRRNHNRDYYCCSNPNIIKNYPVNSCICFFGSNILLFLSQGCKMKLQKKTKHFNNVTIIIVDTTYILFWYTGERLQITHVLLFNWAFNRQWVEEIPQVIQLFEEIKLTTVHVKMNVKNFLITQLWNRKKTILCSCISNFFHWWLDRERERERERSQGIQ